MSKTDKVEQLKYEWSKDGHVLTVSKPDGSRIERFDTREVDEKLTPELLRLGFRTKLGYSAPAKATHDEKLDHFLDQMADLRDGDWESAREKLPDWIKTKEARAIIAAAAILKGYPESVIRANFAALGKDALIKAGENAKIKAKMAELAAGAPVDLTDF